MSTRTPTQRLTLGAKRRDMVSQGAYDGRFRSRTVKDKKKEITRLWARGKNQNL